MSKNPKIVDFAGGWELRQSRDGRYRWCQGGSGATWNPVEGKWTKDAPWSETPEKASVGLEGEITRLKEYGNHEERELQKELYRMKDEQ